MITLIMTYQGDQEDRQRIDQVDQSNHQQWVRVMEWEDRESSSHLCPKI